MLFMEDWFRRFRDCAAPSLKGSNLVSGLSNHRSNRAMALLFWTCACWAATWGTSCSSSESARLPWCRRSCQRATAAMPISWALRWCASSATTDEHVSRLYGKSLPSRLFTSPCDFTWTLALDVLSKDGLFESDPFLVSGVVEEIGESDLLSALQS